MPRHLHGQEDLQRTVPRMMADSRKAAWAIILGTLGCRRASPRRALVGAFFIMHSLHVVYTGFGQDLRSRNLS